MTGENTIKIGDWQCPVQDGRIAFHRVTHQGRLVWLGIASTDNTVKWQAEVGQVVCYEPGQNKPKWASPRLSDWPRAVDMNAAGQVLVTTDNGRVTCFDKAGNIVWQSANAVWALDAWFAPTANTVQMKCGRAGLVTASMAGWRPYAPKSRGGHGGKV